MNIIKVNEGCKLLLELEGRLDTMTAPQLEKELEDSLKNVAELVLDMEKLDYISSAGLRVLLGAQKQMNRQGSMELHHVCEEVQDVFDMTGFSDILTIV
ncbi:STAS domain-containing protein [uncultured Robinsoniella sp.]|uniref:STAS domain-containing protein n=1 Tax=uncultured Robinsoniella sp. TaxID=904190 RepID=UPI00374ED7D9